MNHQKPPKGVSVQDHYKNREKAWKNLKGQNIRESNFTNHTLHFSDTRLEDGSTICLWTDSTYIRNAVLARSRATTNIVTTYLRKRLHWSARE